MGNHLTENFLQKQQVPLPNSEVRTGERRAQRLRSAGNKNETPSADPFGRRGIFLRKQLTNKLAYANLWVVRDEREKSPPPHTSLLSSPHFGFSNLSGHQNARGQASPLAPDPAVGIHAAGSFFAQKKRSAEKCSADRFLKNGGGVTGCSGSAGKRPCLPRCACRHRRAPAPGQRPGRSPSGRCPERSRR